MRASGYFILAVFFAALGIAACAARVINAHLPKSPEPMYLNSGEKGHCSGSYLGKGYVLTANHCLNDGALSWKAGDLVFTLNTVWTSPENDIAVLRNVDITKTFPGLMGARFTCDVPAIGEDFTAAGYPIDMGLIHKRGYIGGKTKKIGPWDNGVPVILPLFFGDSGGPAYNSRGEIFAVMVGVIDTPVAVVTPLSPVCAVLPR